MAENVSGTTQAEGAAGDTYALAIVVEEGLELDNVGVADNAHDLEFAVLIVVSTGTRQATGERPSSP